MEVVYNPKSSPAYVNAMHLNYGQLAIIREVAGKFTTGAVGDIVLSSQSKRLFNLTQNVQNLDPCFYTVEPLEPGSSVKLIQQQY